MNPEIQNQLMGFIKGETTWAELEGMTQEQAHDIAQIGCELAAAGRLDEAQIIFEGLLAGNPKDASAWAALGTVFQQLGRPDEALVQYDSAIACDSAHAVALANRGELRLRLGDTGGVEDLKAAVAADPDASSLAAKRAQAILGAIR
jgi:Flp pilus assembly protein TadD